MRLRQPTVARLEAGARPITLTEAAVLARVLGVRLADLWDQPEAPSQPADVAAAIRRLEQADVRLKQLEAAEESSLAERALLNREIAGMQVAISTTRRHISEMEELLMSTEEGARAILERREQLVAGWSDDHGQAEEKGVRP